MRYRVVLAPEAIEDLNRLKANLRAAICDGIETYLRHDPLKTSRSRIKRLRKMSQPQFRLRIGDVRVFYDVIENRVEILGIVLKPETATWLAQRGRSE